MDSSWLNFCVSLEIFFMKFYHRIVKAENVPGLANTHEGSLRKVKKAYRLSTLKAGNSDIRFDLPEMRCAYIFQYATLFSSAVSFHFVQMLKQNQPVLEKLLAQDTLVICCLGGGPATELVAIAKAIEHMLGYFSPEILRLKKVHAVVVDIDSGWSVTANHVVRHLNSLSAVDYRLTFIKSDLAEPLTDELQTTLRKAHIVTSIKFLSVLYSKKGRSITRLFVQRVVNCTPRGTLIFFLDSSVEKYRRVFMDSMESLGSMVPIYGPFGRDVYSLSRFTVTGRLKLFYESYRKQRFSSRTKNCVSCWCKEHNQQVPLQTPAVSSDQWRTNWDTDPWIETYLNYQVFGPRRESGMTSTHQLFYPCVTETHPARICCSVNYDTERNDFFLQEKVYMFNTYRSSAEQFSCFNQTWI